MNQDAAGGTKSAWSPAARALITTGAAVVVLLGMKQASSVLNSVFLALFITLGFSPLMAWMRKRGAPIWLALIIVLLIILIVVLLIVAVMVSSLGGIQDRLPFYQDRVTDIIEGVQRQLAEWGVNLSNVEFTDILNPGALVGFAGTLATTILSSLSSVLIMLLVVIFMLAEATGFSRKVRTGISAESGFAASAGEFGADIRSYLFLKGIISFIAAVPITLLYFFMGVDFALLWGLVFFLFSFVPNVGYVLSLIPPALVTWFEFGLVRMIILVAINIVINTVVDNVISPRVMGRGLDLSTLVVFLSLLFWGWVLGPLGALLSVPLTLMIKRLFLERYDETRWLAVLMGQGPRNRRIRRRPGPPGEPGKPPSGAEEPAA